jgi:phage terminase large subunit-like protein
MNEADHEEGPDPNDVRRHAKKMLTEQQYRDEYCKILRYRPHPRQLAAHNSSASRLALIAGNQQGKTTCIGAQMAIDITGTYDDFEWYEGPRLESRDMLAWAASSTATMTRDGVQAKLLGDLNCRNGIGTGLIPLDYIAGKPSMATRPTGFVDTATIKRATGGTGTLRLKTFEQGRQAFQTEPVHRLWLDEDPGFGATDLWGECLVRLTTTRGRVYFSATAMYGKTPVVAYFQERSARGEDCVIVTMGIEDALHIRQEDRAGIIAACPEWERDARIYGRIQQGSGRVFSTPEDQIKYTRDLREFPWPDNWPWLAAVDFSHAGGSATGHPFAYVLGVHDQANNIIYIVRCVRMRGGLPVNHVAAIKEHVMWDARTAWPHDGNIRTLDGSETFAGMYKRLGLNMDSSHATFPGGGFDYEASLTEISQRCASGTLRVPAHEAAWFEEYRNLHWKDNKVVKEDDDLISATRILCMAIRRAKIMDRTQLGQPDYYARPQGAFSGNRPP